MVRALDIDPLHLTSGLHHTYSFFREFSENILVQTSSRIRFTHNSSVTFSFSLSELVKTIVLDLTLCFVSKITIDEFVKYTNR